MAKHIRVMEEREREMAKLLELLSIKSAQFENPEFIMIGGYALRAFTSLARYTRDCDFVLRKETTWKLDKIKKWLEEYLTVATLEKHEDYGFMRCIKPVKVGNKLVKVSLDFMEGKVVGRKEKDQVFIDESFVSESKKEKIEIAGKEFIVYVPTYKDYFILKIISCRRSDIRDIATLVWQKGIPENIKSRVKKILPYPDILSENLKQAITDISNKRFVDSWRGTFISTDFNESAKQKILEELQKLLA